MVFGEIYIDGRTELYVIPGGSRPELLVHRLASEVSLYQLYRACLGHAFS
jgi:hypothetical protein